MTELETFRAAKDRFFALDPDSPLTPQQKREFHGLKYFPENPALHLEVPLEEFPDKHTVSMQTTTGDVQEYQRYGKIKFSIDGQEAELVVYAADHGDLLPFVDALAGKETYPAGRYFEPEMIGKGRILVDFNYAYNPYCAYNEAWSCPITPAENRLKVPIQAGEKIFHEESID